LVTDKIDKLVTGLREVFGERLRAVVLYGSAAAGEHIAGRSDYNVLVIADELPVEKLRAAGAITRSWTTSGNPPPLVFTAEEWRTSADVFPMEYADILERNRVLFGDPELERVRYSREHLRLQVEQEARGKLLHLRQAVIGAGADAKAQLAIFERTLSQIMVLFRGAARLHGDTPPKDYEALSRTIAARAGFNSESLVRVVRHVRGTEPIKKEAASDALGGYLIALERLVRHLDQIAHGA
jgi:hypothetical protein